MPWEDVRVRAPELEGGAWINAPPVRLADRRGRPVLVDFWDYTCVNCLRTLPYLVQWDRRYRPLGLTIIGVHTPEFPFARDEAAVRRAVEDLGITYPVVLDRDARIWQAYANRYWPAKYLIDGERTIRYHHLGEGAYGETELAIQRLLTEAGADPARLPEPLPPLRDTDRPGAVCHPVTPELYLGWYRGRPGNPEPWETGRVALFRDPGAREEGRFYLDGPWLLEAEYALQPQADPRWSSLSFRYTAKEVNVVVHPAWGGTGRLLVEQDGVPLPPDRAGADVHPAADGTSHAEVRQGRMYRLVDNPAVEARTLTLRTDLPGLAFYAVTFVSACAVPGEP